MATVSEVLGDDGKWYPSPFTEQGIKQRRWAHQRAVVERRLAKLRVKGPINGRLYVCYDWRKPGRCATALTPEGALNAWRSYWGLVP